MLEAALDEKLCFDLRWIISYAFSCVR